MTTGGSSSISTYYIACLDQGLDNMIYRFNVRTSLQTRIFVPIVPMKVCYTKMIES